MTLTLVEELEAAQLRAFEEAGYPAQNISEYFEREIETRTNWTPDFFSHLSRTFGNGLPSASSLQDAEDKLRQDYDAELAEVFGANAESTIRESFKKYQSNEPGRRYQNPIILWHLERLWELVQSAQALFGEADGSRRKPCTGKALLASAPTGNFNAYALADDCGNSAIMFEEGIFDWSTCLSHSIACILGEVRNGVYGLLVSSDPVEVRQFLDKNSDFLEVLGQYFLSFAATGRPGGPVVPLSPSTFREIYSIAVVDAGAHIRTGFLTMIMSHEYSHLRLGHHAIRFGKAKGPFKMLGREFVGRMWTQFTENYSDRFQAPTKTQLWNFGVWQAQEFEADAKGCADSLASAFAKNRSAEGAALLTAIGTVSFFYFIEYFERLIRLLESGSDGSSDPLLSRDYEAQNVFLRKSHPCPMSRLQFVGEYVRDIPYLGPVFDPLSSLIGELFDAFWKANEVRFKKSHADGIRPHRKWRSSFSEMYNGISGKPKEKA